MSSSIEVTVVLHSLDPPRFGLRHPYSNALIAVYKVRDGQTFTLHSDHDFMERGHSSIYQTAVGGSHLFEDAV